jgi:hypothetical protein
MHPSPLQTDSALCAICQSSLSHGEEQTECPECRSAYHEECWLENGGCAVYGCAQVPPTEGRAALEIPAAYWGRENKPCPQCGKEILAAAVRCRHCGATFSSSRPEDSAEFHKREETIARLPALKRNAVLVFVFCALPCSALPASIAGLIWYMVNRDALGSAPTLYSGLAKVGLGVGFAQSVLVLLVALFYSAFHQA